MEVREVTRSKAELFCLLNESLPLPLQLPISEAVLLKDGEHFLTENNDSM